MQKSVLCDLNFELRLFSCCTCLGRMGILLPIETILPWFNIPGRLTATEISYANAICQKNYRNREMIVIREQGQVWYAVVEFRETTLSCNNAAYIMRKYKINTRIEYHRCYAVNIDPQCNCSIYSNVQYAMEKNKKVKE